MNRIKTSVLFIPDIDKWGKWEDSILEWIQKIDMAFLDATFYQNGEISGRDMSEIPHPFVEESMALFNSLSEEDKSKSHFIHFNHTNPLLFPRTDESKTVKAAGFKIAVQGQIQENMKKRAVLQPFFVYIYSYPIATLLKAATVIPLLTESTY